MLGPRSRSEIDFLEKKSENVLNTEIPPFSYLRDIRAPNPYNLEIWALAFLTYINPFAYPGPPSWSNSTVSEGQIPHF